MIKNDEIRRKALRAARVVTLGAMIGGGAVACSDEEPTTQSDDMGWTQREPDTGLPPVVPDAGTPDMEAPAPDMSTPSVSCRADAQDQLCPEDCAPRDDVDCCLLNGTDCTFDQANGCSCSTAPTCNVEPNGVCDQSCGVSQDGDCCAESAPAGQRCAVQGGQCACEPLPTTCDFDTSDDYCPPTCTTEDDLDCCAESAGPDQICGGPVPGGPPGCVCRTKPACEANTSDNECPSYCTPQDDADCCRATASAPNESCIIDKGTGACGCVAVDTCEANERDFACPSTCTTNNDADCCADSLDGFCTLDPVAMTCGCAVPGPFMPPRMRHGRQKLH